MTNRSRHVLERLPAHRSALIERMSEDRDFSALCEDYGVALDALRHWEASSGPHRQARVEEFRHLLAELEKEILVELGVA